MTKNRFILAFSTILLILTACSRSREVDSGLAGPDIHALQLRTLESLWTAVDENYVYPDVEGVDWQEVHDAYLARVEAELSADEFTSVMEEMLAELPAGTASLQTREERIEQATTDISSYEGIGAFVAVRREPEPRVILLSVMPGSPAEAAGLQAHDSILAVDGKPIEAEEDHNPITYIRGPANTEVTLSVRTPNNPAREVTVKRGRIGPTPSRVHWEMLDDGRTGYFLFPPATYDNLLQDFLAGVQVMTEAGDLEAIILDLRVVAVGDTWPAIGLLSLFTNGVIGEVYTRSETTSIPVEGIDDFADTQQMPVAILIGPDTRGPAEVFAAVMKELRRGIVLGNTTSGNVESLAPFYLPDGSRLFLATSSFRTTSGLEVGLLGVEPDVLMDVDWDAVTADDDPVLDAARQTLHDNGG